MVLARAGSVAAAPSFNDAAEPQSHVADICVEYVSEREAGPFALD